MAIIDVKDCAMQISVVNAQEQEKENVPVDKLVSILFLSILFILFSKRTRFTFGRNRIGPGEHQIPNV